MPPPLARPTVPRTVGGHETRIRVLERLFRGPVPVLVWGAIYNDGNIIEGVGFTVVDDGIVGGVEQYTITFDTPFVNPPVVLLTGNNNNGPGGDNTGRYTVTLRSRTNTEIVVITSNVDDPDQLGAQDGGFDFLAVEPGV